jgi:hypothetical protein
VYIHDFLVKSGFRNAAQQFHAEAGLGDNRAPIDVSDGGLLHE